ncbi:DUF1800 domain-containing protein [Nocardioides mangrovicus]|uniref:DUF1800 domain-containing protein n=1 Tax=Nocardioides mangrovicus TaxID=2478913 RepID=A0A3L8NYQ1_9ACTN|nr:DUF1800 domain-containing protein [Nocardioides mangrovicus]RLV47489.1 DUF1800 domain-containing protein [Nocardioides mangrovicus]
MTLLAADPAERRKPRKKRRRRKHKHQVSATKPTTSKPSTSKPTVTPIVTAANPLLSPTALHLARRFSFGVTPALGSAINGAGGARAWLVQQMTPSAVTDPAGDTVNGWFAFLNRTPQEIYSREKAGTEGSWVVMDDLSKWTVARRIHSTRQVHEVMVDFWSNLFNVALGNGNGAAYARADYDQVIRQYAFTSFEQLLQKVIVHPAMGIYLNNNVSTKTAPNENLGRELLELHTVGFGAGYTEANVKDSAKILTGYRVDTWPTFNAYYDTARHYTGAVSVMDFSSTNTAADGQAVTMAYLSYLAKHPKTAARIARRLCVRFVSDNPSADLVSTVAAAYTASNTDIKTTLLALVDHPEFNASVGKKLRSPQEDYQAMVRSLGITLAQPSASGDFVNAMLWQYKTLGAPPYEWAPPNGYPEVNAAWSSAGRMLNSFSSHRNMVAHWWPTTGATLPDLATLFPPLPATLQNVIDVVSTNLLGETPGPTISGAIATLLGWPLTHVMTQAEANSYWRKIAIVSTLLDSPLHLYR